MANRLSLSQVQKVLDGLGDVALVLRLRLCTAATHEDPSLAAALKVRVQEQSMGHEIRSIV